MARDAPRLYANQYVSTVLSWGEVGLQLQVDASMFAPGAWGVLACTLYNGPA